MKKFFLLLICIFSFLYSFAETEYRRPHCRALHPVAQSFINHNFPHHRILDIDYKDGGRCEVELTGDIEIKFNSSGRWTKIESHRYGVPYSALPSVVRRRVKERYGHLHRIIQVKRHGDCLDVKLANHRKLKIYTHRNCGAPITRPRPCPWRGC